MKTAFSENPFRYGCVVDGGFYCPRPLLEKELGRFIRAGQNVVLHGERRMGKTSLVHATVSGMRGWRMLYVDLLHVRTVGDVCRRIVTGVKAMKRKAPLFERALRLLPRLRPVMKIDPTSGEVGFSFDPQAVNDPYAIEDVVDMLSRIAADHRTVIVFDEFQDIRNLGEHQQLLALLRGRIQFQGDVPYVFTGSLRSQMVDLFDNPDSAFYKSALTLCVGGIEHGDFRRFLVRRFAGSGRVVDAEVVDRVMETVAEVPGDVQQLCEALWSVAGKTVLESDIARALELVFMREGDKFEGFCDQLSPIQFRMLCALARVGGREVQSKSFLAEADVANAASARKAIKRLEELRLVYCFQRQYRFVSQFFRAWLLKRQY